MFKSFFNQVRSNSEEVRSDVSAQPTNLICSHREHLTYYLLLITYSLEFFLQKISGGPKWTRYCGRLYSASLREIVSFLPRHFDNF